MGLLVATRSSRSSCASLMLARASVVARAALANLCEEGATQRSVLRQRSRAWELSLYCFINVRIARAGSIFDRIWEHENSSPQIAGVSHPRIAVVLPFALVGHDPLQRVVPGPVPTRYVDFVGPLLDGQPSEELQESQDGLLRPASMPIKTNGYGSDDSRGARLCSSSETSRR